MLQELREQALHHLYPISNSGSLADLSRTPILNIHSKSITDRNFKQIPVKRRRCPPQVPTPLQ
jgi:hypothetical protein